MTDDFFKFPSTPHLFVPPGLEIRDDKVLLEEERSAFLQHELVLEEKIDGANLGISFGADGNVLVQNRGAYLQLPAEGQWSRLERWLAPRLDILFDHLSDQFILFGEWCYARHSVAYDRLPDWFLGFDLYDKQTGRFLSFGRRNALLDKMHIVPVPFLARGHFSLPDLCAHFSTSKVGSQQAEGIYLRIDQGDWLAQRAKIVRPSFVQTIEQHWSRTGITPNQVNQAQ